MADGITVSTFQLFKMFQDITQRRNVNKKKEENKMLYKTTLQARYAQTQNFKNTGNLCIIYYMREKDEYFLSDELLP